MLLKEIILNTLKNEVLPAMGCTEPVAVALACAKAKEIINEESIENVDVYVSPNIYKNGLGVGIPNTNEVGLDIAASLGVVLGNSEKALRLLEDVKEEDLVKAHKLIEQKKIIIDIKDTDEKIYIEVIIKSGKNYSKVIIKEKHNCFTHIEKNGELLYYKICDTEKNNEDLSVLYNSKISDIIKEIEKIDYHKLLFLLDGIEMNEAIAREALSKKLGLGVGYNIKESIEKGILSDDLMNNSMMLTAAASDARMAGLNMPVMSSNGSGNNGLTAILPIAAYKRKFDVSDEKLSRALAISHIINCYIKNYIGRLSALCGCGVAAATGASAAITWLLEGSYNQIDGAIKNMIANISGMICDGAKSSCALKVSTSASVAIQSALLALNDSITSSKNGIIADSAEDTIKNLGILSNKGMGLTDKVILDIMKKIS